MKKKILFLLLIMVLIPTNTYALNEVNIYLFHSTTCNICSQEKAYLEALKQRYPNIRVYLYDISDSSNNDLMIEAKKMYGIKKAGVPFTVIGDSAYLGFSQSKKGLFQKKVYEYSTKKYNNVLGKELGISYRDDLEGKVEEYKDNDNYQIEEQVQVSTGSDKKKDNGYDKYKATFYLVGAGLILSVIAIVISILEKKKRFN